MASLPPDLSTELAAVWAAWARGEDPWRELPTRVPLAPETACAYAGRRVLVTGGGGFIGAALARVLGRLGAEVLALDKDEAGLVRLQDAARADNGREPGLALADCRIAERLGSILDGFRPEMVFHCAAHKHLPLLQSQPDEAWLNNVTAVRNLGRELGGRGVEAFLLVSTDKAVEPVSHLGASKQAAEQALQAEGAHWAQRAAVARLANVLASGGSVVERFWRALRLGRALEVTHPEMARYFLTRAQAVGLLLAAGAAARAGDLWAPRLAAPVQIVDLAGAALVEGLDLGLPTPPAPGIRFTAPWPGEKLSERLLAPGEAARAQSFETAGLAIWRVPAS